MRHLPPKKDHNELDGPEWNLFEFVLKSLVNAVNRDLEFLLATVHYAQPEWPRIEPFCEEMRFLILPFSVLK
jgi:hypothetical protein